MQTWVVQMDLVPHKQYIIMVDSLLANAYFTDEEQIQNLEAEGLDLHPMNSDRIRSR